MYSQTKCPFTGLRKFECAHCRPSTSLAEAAAYDAAHPEFLDVLVDEDGQEYVEYYTYDNMSGISCSKKGLQ